MPSEVLFFLSWIQDYLVKYGYLPKANEAEKMDSIPSGDKLKDALIDMQKMAGIPQTGNDRFKLS